MIGHKLLPLNAKQILQDSFLMLKQPITLESIVTILKDMDPEDVTHMLPNILLAFQNFSHDGLLSLSGFLGCCVFLHGYLTSKMTKQVFETIDCHARKYVTTK